ncbi:hypothetical protein [Ekhidna sp.]
MRAIFISLSAFLSILSITTIQEDELIVGTWVSKEDSNWRFIFKNPKTCFEYYNGKLTEEYSFSISNSSPQCNKEVFVNQNTSYLKLKSNSDSEMNCYEIASLNDESLTLRVVGRGGFMEFIRDSNTAIPIRFSDPSKGIIGTWYSEGDRTNKWTYSDNGLLYEYWNSKVESVYKYSISHSCDSEYDPDFYFMEWIDENGDIYCFEINSVNENNSDILSLTSMKNGKIYLFNR